MKKISLLGIGHNTPVFIEIAEQCGYEISGLFHYNGDRTGEIINGYSITGSVQDLFERHEIDQHNFLLTMGNNEIRSQTAQKLRNQGGILPTLIHPTAVVSRFATISDGVVISPLTYIQANTKIDKDTIILSGVNISHDNTVGQACFIAGGATIGAFTKVGDFVFIGQGALTISEKVSEIGDSAFIGAGSLVTKSVAAQTTVKGHPAKVII